MTNKKQKRIVVQQQNRTLFLAFATLSLFNGSIVGFFLLSRAQNSQIPGDFLCGRRPRLSKQFLYVDQEFKIADILSSAEAYRHFSVSPTKLFDLQIHSEWTKSFAISCFRSFSIRFWAALSQLSSFASFSIRFWATLSLSLSFSVCVCVCVSLLASLPPRFCLPSDIC